METEGTAVGYESSAIERIRVDITHRDGEREQADVQKPTEAIVIYRQDQHGQEGHRVWAVVPDRKICLDLFKAHVLHLRLNGFQDADIITAAYIRLPESTDVR